MGRMKDFYYDQLLADDIEYNERQSESKEREMEEYFAIMEEQWLTSEIKQEMHLKYLKSIKLK